MSADIINITGRRNGEDPKPEKSPARFWMRHDVKTFAFETSTVDAEGAGALILLRGYYFMTGGLPQSDAECCKVCRLSARKFARIRSWLFSFFDEQGRSAELDATIEETERFIESRREAGRRGGASKSLARARHVLKQNSDQLESESKIDSQKEKPSSSSSEEPSPSPAPNSEPRAREAIEIAAECLAVMPTSMKADPRMRGFKAWIERLHAEGVDRAAIIEGVTRSVPSLDGPPATFEYFRPAIDRAAASRRSARPVPSGADAVSLQTFTTYIEREIGRRPGTLAATVDGGLLDELHERFTAKAIGFNDVLSAIRAALSQGGAA